MQGTVGRGVTEHNKKHYTYHFSLPRHTYNIVELGFHNCYNNDSNCFSHSKYKNNFYIFRMIDSNDTTDNYYNDYIIASNPLRIE